MSKIYGIWDGQNRAWIKNESGNVFASESQFIATSLCIELKTAHDRKNFYVSPIPEAPLNRDARWPAIVKRN